MKKGKLYSGVISVDMFYSEVVVLLTNSKDYLFEEMESLMLDDLGMKEKDAECFSKEIKRVIEEDGFLSPGMTISIKTSSGSKELFVIFEGTPKTITNEVIIHEMCHAMQHICAERGVEDNETEAYLLEYLCHTFFTQLTELRKDTKKG